MFFDRLLEKCKRLLFSYDGCDPVYTDDGILDYEANRRANHGKNNLDAIIEESKRKINRVVMVGGSSRILKYLKPLRSSLMILLMKMTSLRQPECSLH